MGNDKTRKKSKRKHKKESAEPVNLIEIEAHAHSSKSKRKKTTPAPSAEPEQEKPIRKTYKFETDDHEIAKALSLKVLTVVSKRFEAMEQNMLALEAQMGGETIGAMAQYGVPDQLLDKLKCSICYELLSHAPIHYHPETGSVCGRHPFFDPEKETQPIQEKNYECIAGIMSFPCRYKANGCTERYTMSQMPEHEESCDYKPYFCPVLPLGDCAWQGASRELHSHFATNHQMLLLEKPEFELDIVNNYKEHYLIPYGEELFLMRVEFQNSDKMFRCSVHYVGKPGMAQNFEYQIVFKTADAESTWEQSKLLVESDSNILQRRSEYSVSLATLNELLHHPSFITCEIRINELEPQIPEIPSEDDEDSSEANSDFSRLTIREDDKLLESVECQVCQEYMVPPIFQCVVGHNVCETCKPKLQDCPTCRGQIGATRNFALEKLTEIMQYPCKNIDEGCTHRTNSLHIRNHEMECEYKPRLCILNESQKCQWTGRLTNLWQHCKTEHGTSIQKGDYFQTTYNPECERFETYKIKYEFGLLFKLIYTYDKNNFTFACICITRPKDAAKMMYETEVLDLNNVGLKLISKKMCGFLSDNKDDMKHCTTWNMNMIKPFISQNDIRLKLRCIITKN